VTKFNPALLPLWLFGCVFVISSCSNDAPIAAKAKNNRIESKGFVDSYRLTETFNVGRNVFVRALALDEKQNNLWVGTSVGVLQVDPVKGEVKQTFTRENGLANEYVFAVFSGSHENTWFGTNGGGVSKYDGKSWKSYFPMHGLADYWVYSFTEQKEQALWIGTWAGLNRVDYKTGEFKTYVQELVNEWVYGLDVDSKNQVWIGTEGGVNMFDGVDWHVWTSKDGLGASNNKKLPFSDNTGLGTRSRHNLSVLVEGSESYNPDYVFCVKVSDDDRVWVGTWGGGVSYFDGKSWNNLTVDDGLAGNIVYSIAIENGDTFWFGTNNGVSRYYQGHWQSYGKEDGLLDDHVYAIVTDNHQKMWLGTRNGVSLLEKKKD